VMHNGICSSVSNNPDNKVSISQIHEIMILTAMLADALLNQFDVSQRSGSPSARLLPFAVEASIMTAKWSQLSDYLQLCSKENVTDFTIGIGSALNALRLGKKAEFNEIIHNLRHTTVKAMTFNSTTSLQSCHDSLLHLHALTEVEAIVNASPQTRANPAGNLDALSRRLDILGVYITEKQYLLGLRRAAMELSYVVLARLTNSYTRSY
jgi:serine/threonine-protein kinase ATR